MPVCPFFFAFFRGDGEDRSLQIGPFLLILIPFTLLISMSFGIPLGPFFFFPRGEGEDRRFMLEVAALAPGSKN